LFEVNKFLVLENLLALLLALVSRGKVRQVKVPMLEAPNLSRGIVHNVGAYCVWLLGAKVK
jgi:hypothetical protein